MFIWKMTSEEQPAGPSAASSARPERPAREPAMGQPEGDRRADAAPAIRQAIEEVQKINRDLESLLLEMEKALETLEEAEVQKYAEEREIESLRSAVRQLNRVRENVQRPQQQGRPERPARPENRSRQPSHREDRYRGRQR